MKKMFFALMTMLTVSISVNAMSYEQARNEALFLTDKMAYELNLTDEQYEAAYEINLDYLMGVTGRNDVFGTYWERRNLDLSYIMLEWQWNAFIAASYFYRPLYWEAGYWHFGIYRRYPHRDYFYFGRPHFYVTYRGGHAWHRVGGHGYYHGHRNHFHAPHREHFGMHDRWNRGDFRGSRHSSTRITGRNHEPRRIGSSGSGNFNGHRNNGYSGGGNFDRDRNNGNFDRGRNNGNFEGGRNNGNFDGRRNNGNFDGRRNNGYGGGGNFDRGRSNNSARIEGNMMQAQSRMGQGRSVNRGRSVDFSSNRGSSTRSTAGFSGSGSFSRGGSFSHGGGSHGGGSFSHGGGSHGGGSHGGHGGMGGRR
jgi:hypothetical protein